MSLAHWLLLAPFAVVALFQGLYLLLSFRVRILPAPAEPSARPEDLEPVSIVIPLFNSAATIGLALESILRNDLRLLSKVVVVHDRCVDGSEAIAEGYVERFRARGVPLDVVALPAGRAGKVDGLLFGSAHAASDLLLLMDADIVLAPTAVAELLAFRRRSAAIYACCLIYPYQATGESHSLTSQIVCNNRLYRQGVIQAVKNLHRVANFPGGFQLVHFPRYRELLAHGFLEDLSATYEVLARGGDIAVLPRVLAYEVERTTLRNLFLQRVRWTIGAIQHLPTQLRTARKRGPLPEKLLVNSYHMMWEFQHYAIVLGVAAAAAGPPGWPAFLAPLVLYGAQILRSASLARPYYRNSPAGVVLHCLVFPAIISAALVGSCALLLKNRRFFFHSAALYRRH